MAAPVGNVIIALICTFLFVTNLVAICFIATDPNIHNNSNTGVIEASYIGVGSTITLAAIGTVYYWCLVSGRATKL
jgi:hypothetical protein